MIKQYGFLPSQGSHGSLDGSPLKSPSIIYGNMEEWVATLFYVYYLTNQILSDFWCDTVRTEPRSLPVPVYDLARWLGFSVELHNLNRYRDMQISLVLGKLKLSEETIYVDNGIGVSNSDRRYAVAHELGHAYLCEENAPNSQDCMESRIPGNRREFLADLFAAFLMLPPRETFQYVITYITENRKRPVDHEKMMLELSDKAKFPFLRTITSYEYLRYAACYEHNHKEDILRRLKNDWHIENADEWLKEPIAAQELYN